MGDIEIIPVAYKFRVKKDGIIHEFITLKDISVKDAEDKIKDFLEYFKPVAIRKEVLTRDKEKESIKDEYSTADDRWVHLVEFMKKYPEFEKQDYVDFMISKGLKFKSVARANDDFHALKEKGLLERSLPHGWKFIATEDKIISFINERPTIRKTRITQASIPVPKQRAYLMYKNMADKEYFTINDWVDFMTTPPNNYDELKIRNNFYHDIINLKGKVKEIKTDDISYKPKRFKIVKIEPQEVDERMIKDLNEGQKVVLGTIK